MNRRQKAILIRFIIVTVVTAVALAAMIIFKDFVNRSEAMRAMEHLGRIVLRYRKESGSVPPESWVNRQRENLPGNVRLGKLRYRARWVDFESTPDEILAYTERSYHSLLLGGGFVVLRLNGRVEWMEKQEFETILARQQSTVEIEMLRQMEAEIPHK